MLACTWIMCHCSWTRGFVVMSCKEEHVNQKLLFRSCNWICIWHFIADLVPILDAVTLCAVNFISGSWLCFALSKCSLGSCNFICLWHCSCFVQVAWILVHDMVSPGLMSLNVPQIQLMKRSFICSICMKHMLSIFAKPWLHWLSCYASCSCSVDVLDYY